MILTIAIPTFNRPDKVLNTVRSLIPQLNNNVQVSILDNCSEINVKDYLENSIKNLNSYPITVVRHKVNIGADANFARCFELCDTPWIWTLGDDDFVIDNAVDTILQEIELYNKYDLIGFNFNSNCNKAGRDKPILISNTHEMANNLDYFGNWLFISTAVYKTQEYFKHIRYATWGAYSMASQIVPAMLAISNNKTFVLSEKTIADNIPAENMDDRWSTVKLSLVITSLIEVPVHFNNDFINFGRKLAVQQLIPLSAPIYEILKSVNNNLSLIDNYHIYLYKQFYYRSIDFRRNKLKLFFEFKIWCFLLKNTFFLGLVSNLFKKRFEKNMRFFGKFDLFIR